MMDHYQHQQWLPGNMAQAPVNASMPTAKVNLVELWSTIDSKQNATEEQLFASLKAILSATYQFDNLLAAFTLKRLQCLENIICSPHTLIVLCSACTLVHLACSSLELQEVVMRSGVIPPICEALQWQKGDLDASPDGQIRTQLLEIAVSVVLQLTSGSVKTVDVLHEENVITTLLTLIRSESSPLFDPSTDKKDLPKYLVGKTLVGNSKRLDSEQIRNIYEDFYGGVASDINSGCMYRPIKGFVVDLYKSCDTNTQVAWEMANAGHLWLKQEKFDADEWLTISPTSFITNSIFWAQLGENAAGKQERISERLRQWPNKILLQCPPTTGSYVGYHCTISKVHHRCQVIDVSAADGIVGEVVNVICLDTGRVMRVLNKDLFLLVPEMQLKQFEYLATICKLHGVTSTPMSTRILELALTALYNLATATDRLEPFNTFNAHEVLLQLGQCGEMSVMWRSMRVLANLARSLMTPIKLLDTNVIQYVLGLCARYPDMSSQCNQDTRLLLQASLRLLANLVWEFEDARTALASQKGLQILTGLVKASTGDVTSEAFSVLKSFLGRTMIASLTVRDLRMLKPQTSAECDDLDEAMAELSTGSNTSDEGKDVQRPRKPARLSGSFGRPSQASAPRAVIADVEDAVSGGGGGGCGDGEGGEQIVCRDMADLEKFTDFMIRNEPCGFVEDARHAFLQVENNNIKYLGRKTMQQLACGFLNSDDGGSIFLGVSATGIVAGLSITRNERDSLRMGLDVSMSKMRGGNVLPQSYDVRITPVCKQYWRDGHCVQEEVKDLVVTEIILIPNIMGKLYYVEPQDVYLREGAQTIQASAYDIQKRRIEKLEADYLMEMKGLKSEIRRLKAK